MHDVPDEPQPPNRRVRWRPQPDITTYELALCIEVMVLMYAPGIERSQVYDWVDTLPPEAQRHFSIIDA